jgi:tryptophan-rich sensory protein
VLALIVCLLASLTAGAIGGFATVRAISSWYPSLVKPAWTPPSWLFGPVWTVLYILMGIAAWRVWLHAGEPLARQALAIFVVQLVLNAAWSLLFFGLRAPGLAMAELVLLWLAVAATLGAFWRIEPLAGALLIPYLAWVTFAGGLNHAIWWLNR